MLCIWILQKAFHYFPNQWLLMKLKGYGLSGKTRKWTEDFLLQRNQQVVVNGVKSHTRGVSSEWNTSTQCVGFTGFHQLYKQHTWSCPLGHTDIFRIGHNYYKMSRMLWKTGPTDVHRALRLKMQSCTLVAVTITSHAWRVGPGKFADNTTRNGSWYVCWPKVNIQHTLWMST